MIRILVTKDGATIVPKDVADLAEAKVVADNGFDVHVVQDDGSKVPLAEAIAEWAAESARVAANIAADLFRSDGADTLAGGDDTLAGGDDTAAGSDTAEGADTGTGADTALAADTPAG